jgi:hypothetical protein
LARGISPIRCQVSDSFAPQIMSGNTARLD